jgi:hypothetical protein
MMNTKHHFGLALGVGLISAVLLGSCTSATDQTPVAAVAAWQDLTPLSLPLNFETGSAVSKNISDTAGYLNTYSGGLAISLGVSTLNPNNRRTLDYGTSVTNWEAPAAAGWSVGSQNLLFEVATGAANGRVDLAFRKVTFPTLTATSGISFDLELPLDSAGFMVYLRQCDATGKVVKEYNAKLNGGFDATDDWNWYWDAAGGLGTHWNSFRIPLSRFTSGDSGAGTTAAADLATFTPNQINFVFRLETNPGVTDMRVGDVRTASFDNLTTY